MDFLLRLFINILLSVIFTFFELIAAFIIAALLLVCFNFAGIPFLAGLGYWQLYWLQVAVYQSINSCVVFGLSMKQTLDRLG